jgi:uncharacterized protein YjbI with pentapeptide repeats
LAVHFFIEAMGLLFCNDPKNAVIRFLKMGIAMFKDFAATLPAITAVLAGILGILKYFQYRTRRDKIMSVRQTFDAVVNSLASNVEVERMAGAILLRRFFDRKTEVGISGTPYWKEAVYVTAAILKGQVTGNFQKLLADGLAFAPGLERADLQKTNLQFAYLGSRKVAGSPSDQVITDLSYADFYRADLSSASLKGAKAIGAVFYQARMHNTVLTGTDLRDANFFEADLKGAKFDGAHLYGANFNSSLNRPITITSKLDESGVYRDSEPFKPPERTSEAKQLRVFISKPGFLDYHQQQYVNALQSRLGADMIPQTLDRPYPQFGTIGEIQRLMSDCAGAVIFGFKQLEVRDGLWRSSTPEERQIKDQYMSTPWNQLEAGMAAMLALPIFVVCQREVEGGIFDMVSGEHQIYRVFIDGDWNGTAFMSAFADWCSDVRERSRSL